MRLERARNLERCSDLGSWSVTHDPPVTPVGTTYERYTADVDLSPFFKGLPDDRCQSPHWGYVLKGKMIWQYAEGDEVVTAGDAYFARPGHTPKLTDGTEVVEFSPTDDLQRTMEVVARNMEQIS